MSQLAEKSQQVQPERPSVELAPPPPRKPLSWLKLELTPATLLAALLLVGYGFLFIKSISPFWFDRHWVTDDSLQQVYPFHEVAHPGLFQGDIVTDVMKGYLAPLHYWLCYGITMLTGDPIMMSHWVMLIQITLTVGFLFAGIRKMAGTAPALVGVAWLLHDRNLMQRLTAGLPRGWSAVVLSAFLCFVARGNHRAVLLTILVGCLTNPPATLIVALAYGWILMWRSFVGAHESRRAARHRLVAYVCLSPLFAVVTFLVVQRPPQIGQMVSYEQASKMPEFSRPRGRFPFVPLNPAGPEIRFVGLESFVSRFHNPHKAIRKYETQLILGSLAVLILIGLVRRRVTVPAELLIFGCASLTVYFLSRLLAFRLYVPDRHLQLPLAFFFISTFTVAVWRAFHRGRNDTTETEGALKDSRLCYSWRSALGLVALVGFIYACSGWGLRGAMNFNYSVHKKGYVFDWVKDNTPLNALVAGHPTHIDGLMLFGARRGFITTETAHPFYVRYSQEVKRRNEISLRAHYARSLEELVNILEPEGITYFVFRRADFRPGTLETLNFFPPLDILNKELTSRPLNEYAYSKLPKEVNLARYPFVPFIDSYSTLVDVQALKAHLQARGWTPPAPEGVRALRLLEDETEKVAAASAQHDNKIAG